MKSIGKFVFYFFILLKTEKFLVHSFLYFDRTLKTHYQSFESFSDSFQTCKTLHHEKRPNGVSFKLFSNSLNMKTLSSTCLLHTCKSIWRVISSYPFFWFEWTIYEKGPYGVFFCLHSNSLNMNDTKFSFIGIIKLNTERPV